MWKHWIGNFALIVGSVILGVFIGEIGLRVANIPPQPRREVKAVQAPEELGKTPQKITQPPATPPGYFFTLDWNLGWAHQPGISGWWRVEGNGYVEINSEGMRDRSYHREKPENTVRIAVLGDSFAEAMQVNAEEAFWAILEEKLTNCLALKGRTIEAINFGVSNYGTAQQLILLQQKVGQYSPDLVILAFFTGNDISDNHRKLDNRNRPYFIYKNGELMLDMSFRNPDKTLPPYGLSRVDELPNWLVEHSRILQLVKKIELENRNRWLEAQRQIVYDRVFKEPQDKAWEEAWKVTEELLLLMQEEVKEKQAKFLVVTLSNEVQVNPVPNFQQEWAEEKGITDIFYPDKRIKKLGDRHGFPVLNLAPTFQTYARENQVCLHGFENALDCGGHWNEKGHRLAGELMAPEVCELLARANSGGT